MIFAIPAEASVDGGGIDYLFFDLNKEHAATLLERQKLVEQLFAGDSLTYAIEYWAGDHPVFDAEDLPDEFIQEINDQIEGVSCDYAILPMFNTIPEQPEKGPRADCVTMHVTRDGIQFEFLSKYAEVNYKTVIVKWHDIKAVAVSKPASRPARRRPAAARKGRA